MNMVINDDCVECLGVETDLHIPIGGGRGGGTLLGGIINRMSKRLGCRSC